VAHPDPQPFIDRFVEVCSNDDGIVAAFLDGSLAGDRADGFSDVDLCLITRDDAFDGVVSARTSLIQRLGQPAFVEDWGTNDVVSFVLADGTEAEIFFGREGALDELRPGRHRTLFDRDGILEGVTFAEERSDPEKIEDVLRRTLSWFWHEVSHFVKAVGRDQQWWAAGQLEALRDHCVNLVRVE
jgi:predicted nucleotidyltransferase